MEKGLFVLSKSDWSLHQKGKLDQERHLEKIKEAIKENITDLISEESIITSNGKETVKIPVRSLDQYRFRYNFNQQEQVGQGNGNSKTGDKIANSGDPADGAGQGPGAGEAPGEDIYEAKIEIKELQEILFSELELPNLEENKKKDHLEHTHFEFTDIRRKGIMGNIDKKRTILESMKRSYRNNTQTKGLKIHEEDLRFKTWEDKEKPSTNAVVLAMMDTSGSMGNWEKYIARSFFFWTVRFLRTKYKNVEIRFLAHHTEAKEVDEEGFFTKAESGGTICSSVYKLANQLIDEEYPPDQYNIYAFHFSDGDNLSSDNQRCIQLTDELMKKVNLFGYGETNQYSRNTTLMNVYKDVKNEKFRKHIVTHKREVYDALKTFFKKEGSK